METIEKYQSTEPSTDTRSDGDPATLTLYIKKDTVRMHVELKNRQGNPFTVSNETVSRSTFEKWKEQILANTIRVK